MTCIWADGKHWTPCMMFTYNSAFHIDRKDGKVLSKRMARWTKMAKKYKVDSDRIVYVGKEDSGKTYCPESIEHLRLFFKKYPHNDGCTILRDGGTSMTAGLKQFGFAKEGIYPAAVHQWLSPNDNRDHGVAKARWRSDKTIDFTDDVQASIALMHYIDQVAREFVKTWFKTNLMLDKEWVTVEACDEIMGKKRYQRSKYHLDCLRKFRIWNGEDAREFVPTFPKGLEDSLDGTYWE